jgi:hypothetical protein
VLIFFIAGLLISLRLERVDNLGAYRIPPETGILIPSDFNRSQNSGRLRSFGVDAEGVERLAGSHDEAVLLGATKQRFAQTSGR